MDSRRHSSSLTGHAMAPHDGPDDVLQIGKQQMAQTKNGCDEIMRD